MSLSKQNEPTKEDIPGTLEALDTVTKIRTISGPRSRIVRKTQEKTLETSLHETIGRRRKSAGNRDTTTVENMRNRKETNSPQETATKKNVKM